ncbi:MAG: hypothetical protein WCP24_02670 [bacterium]
MKNKEKGFVIPLIIAIIALLAIGGGVYVYTNKKTVNPPVVNVPKVVNTVPAPIVKDEPKAVTTTTTTTVVKPKTAPVANNNVDTRFDSFFRKWLTAWKNRDTLVLTNTFGYEDFQVQNMADKSIWHYTYELYKSKSTLPTADDIAYYKNNGGEIPYDVKVTAYYIVSKSDGTYNVAIINGDYKKNVEKAGITQWQIYPSEDSPKVFSTIDEAKKQIDKMSGLN